MPDHPLLRIIGHAGLARDLPAAAPTAERLDWAAGRELELLEVDVAVCASRELVLVHDLRLDGGAVVGRLDLAALRRVLPGILTLDEALDVVAGRVPLLLDLKGRGVGMLLGRRLAVSGAGIGGVCTDDLAALLALRHLAPAVARWRTLPAAGEDAGYRRRTAWAALTRSALPARLPLLVREVAAAGVCCDRLVVTAALCAAARRLGVRVTAFTVNSPRLARRLAAAGVGLVTTDHPDLLAGVGIVPGGG